MYDTSLHSLAIKDKQTDIDRQTDRQTDRDRTWTNRQADRQTDKLEAHDCEVFFFSFVA